MKLWFLLSKVDDIIQAYGEEILQPKNEAFKMLIADYLEFEIRSGAELKAYYKREPLDLPDAFWSMISNTDSFMVEKLLLGAGVKSLINLDEIAVARSKSATYQRLAANGIRVPDSMVFFERPNKERVLGKMTYPFVVKPDSGFGGEGVMLINSEADFDEYLLTLEYGVTYIAQEFIASSHGRDARIILLDGEFLYSSMRSATNKDEFRSNAHVGGELLDYEIDEETLELCKRISALFDLPLIGLDLLFGEGEFVIAEVNAFPGLFPENMEKAMAKVIELFMKRQLS